jgi:hypothetical protein
LVIFSIFPLSVVLPSSFLLASSSGDEDDYSGSEDFSDSDDSSGSEKSSGSKNKDIDTRLGSIQSDRENLNRAMSNANPSGKRKAIGELQERYPKKLKNVESLDEFLEKVDEELTSKTKDVTGGSNDSDVDPDEKLNLHEEHVLVDKARNGDKDAVRELQDRFPEFFEGASTFQGLDRVDRMIELEIMENIRNEKPGLSDSEVEAILASMKENNTKKKDKDKDDDDDDDSKGGGDSASGLGGSTSGPSGGSSSAGPSASGGSSSAGPSASGGSSSAGPSASGGSSSKVSSPLDYVLEKESIEMPSLFEGDE